MEPIRTTESNTTKQEVNNVRPVPTDDEDIVGDEDLEDLDFDDYTEWTAPPVPTLNDLRLAKTEIEFNTRKEFLKKLHPMFLH